MEQANVANRKIAIILSFIFFVSMLPIVYIAFFDYAAGDDFMYGAMVHRTYLSGASLLEQLKVAVKGTYEIWNVWQGTWVSVFLFHVTPAVWGEYYYRIVPWIAILCLTIAPAYFFHDVSQARDLFLCCNGDVYGALLPIAVIFCLDVEVFGEWEGQIHHHNLPVCDFYRRLRLSICDFNDNALHSCGFVFCGKKNS